jgi:hypothetical protein
MELIRVPTDFVSLQAAFDHLLNDHQHRSKKYNVMLEVGFAPVSGLLLNYLDCSNVIITSESGTITVSNDFTGYFIRANFGAKAPVIGCVIDMNNKGGDGLGLWNASYGYVLPDCGIINAGQRNFYANRSSVLTAINSVATGANNRNVWIARNARFYGDGGNYSDNKGGDNAVYVSRCSFASLRNATVNNAFINGVAAIRSYVDCEAATIHGAGNRGIVAQRISVVNAKSCNIQNCNIGISAEDGCIINAEDSIIKNNTTSDLNISLGSNINAKGVETTNGNPSTANANVSAFNVIQTNIGVIFA